MKKNMHDYDRIFRFVSGVFLTSLAFWGPRKLGFLAFLFPVATGVVGNCPVYTAFGIDTRKLGTAKKTYALKSEKEQADEYFPIQSPSERAAGHPIVGAS